MSETILSERTNKCLKVMASQACNLSVVSWTDINFWSLPGLPVFEFDLTVTNYYCKCTCPVLNAPRADTPFFLEYPPKGFSLRVDT
jgi:hypothetical protein